jgi:hypothetical protein
MSSFTKLVPEIVESSIWNEPPEIRVVWITMLAKKNSDTGYVRGDARTIARLANVPIDVCERALELFQQPDPTSHTPDNEGRRIAPADGGWTVLNNDKYVEYGMREDQKTIWREQKRLQRAKKQQVSVECPGHVLDKSRNTLDLDSSSGSPEGMQGEAIATVWREWVAYRVKRAKCKDWENMFRRQADMLLDWGPEGAVASMKASMSGSALGCATAISAITMAGAP